MVRLLKTLPRVGFGLTLVVAALPAVAEDAACALPYTPVYQIQGAGQSAAVTGIVTTQGVVVGDFEGSAGLSGFYLQDPTGDGDPATSDGIFVYTGSGNVVTAGQRVRVTG
jgi:predicted extracellular nuclease